MALCAVGVMWRKPCGWSWRRAVAVGYTPEVSQFDMIKKTIKKNILHYFSIYRDFMMIDLSVLPDDLPYVYQIYMTFTHISPSYLSYLPGDNQLNSTIFTRFYQMFFHIYIYLPDIYMDFYHQLKAHGPPFFGTSRVQRGFEGPCLPRGAVGDFGVASCACGGL